MRRALPPKFHARLGLTVARGKFKGNGDKRDGKAFVALPLVVLESAGYRLASHPARALLIDIAMQYTGHNNGKLTACAKYLNAKGWKSNDTITRARHDLLACGLLVETRKGARPNKAAWYALSWFDLDQGQGLDIDPKYYRRGGYVSPEKSTAKNASLAPRGGVAAIGTAPASGATVPTAAPFGGVVRRVHAPLLAPAGGAYLETPSVSAEKVAAVDAAASTEAGLMATASEMAG